jgi:hypothetical protein
MVTNVGTHKQTEDFDNRVQRRTSEGKRVEVTERWSTVHNEKRTTYNPRQILEGLSNMEHRFGRVCGTNGSEKKEFVSKTWRREITWKN